MVNLIVLMNKCGGIAKPNGELPFKNNLDMLNFKKKTIGNIVIMGRKTWRSLPIKPLKNRINIVISSDPRNVLPKGEMCLSSNEEIYNYPSKIKYNVNKGYVYIFKSINDYFKYRKILMKNVGKKEEFVIGGKILYNEFIKRKLISKIFITEMYGYYNFIKRLDFTIKTLNNSVEWRMLEEKELSEMSYQTKENMKYQCITNRYEEFEYCNIEETAFLNRINEILKTGYIKPDRTGTGTLSLFSPSDLRFSLKNNTIPLLTTRKVPLKHVFEELIWFLRGQTDVEILNKKNVNIWKPNTNRDFLNSNNLEHLPEYDLGASYSFQFRHFGAKYKDKYSNYENKGFDQLNYVIELLKNNPDSRRIIINLWNPYQMKNMSLPPCGFCYQFYTTPEKELITKITQRSSDIVLAGGWNIASASLLTYMLASVCGLKPHSIIWSVGDVHIYRNQIENVKQYLNRTSHDPFPKLYINDNAPSILNGKHITEFEYEDFNLLNYNPQKNIKFAFNA